ncbi:hypothetical protein L2E82_43065 [Cichorium intybus]|uniref:Uncharacterized protein n=1 Tax=Cichorium intybus TaxID=13427 RepID=A0ACB8ZNJ4_CICIN|nr:hypothetical protein L2E82_43065 [Cichorium intybus]
MEPKRMRNNDLVGYGEGDRLSRLSDDVLHNIFCYISIKDAIRTSVLSSRWRYVWISLPYLNFENLDRWSSISKFISNVLFHRNNQIQVSSVNLDLGKGVTDDESCLFSQSKPLSSAMESTPHEACIFANAKISKFIPNMHVAVYLEVQAQEKETTSCEIKNYDTSPSVIFPMISHEEVTAMRDTRSAKVLVQMFRVLLNLCKINTNSDTDKAHMDEHGKPQVEMHWAWELQGNLGK